MPQHAKKSDYESKALSELRILSEAQLQSKIVEPLLRALGFENVRDNSGPDEKGKDLVATKNSDFGRNKLYAIQIKKTKLIARVDSSNSLGNLFNQLLQARDEEVVDPMTNTKRSPDVCVFITPYPIAPSVWSKFHMRSKNLDYNNIEVIDGSKLLDLIQRHLPHFLDHFSMEVRYRYEIQRHLNRIPESRLAFGLTEELNLDNIYVEVSLSNRDEFFESIVTRSVYLQGQKLIIAKSHDIARLKKFAVWVDCKPGITDPPKIGSKEEKTLFSDLKKVLEKKSTRKIIQLDLDQLIEKLQQKLRRVLLEFSKISPNTDEDVFTPLAAAYVDAQDNIRGFRDLKPVWDNWIYFVKKEEPTIWNPPEVKIATALLPKIKCNKYILGGPGIGKTTLLRRLASNLSRSSEDVLPIFLSLVSVKGSTMEALLRACISELRNQGYQFGNVKDVTEKFISDVSKGVFHFFFDGIDEVGSNADEIMSCIAKLANNNPKCSVIVSCRSTFIPPPFPGALSLELIPFSTKQLSLFIEKWFSSQPTSLAEIRKWLEANPKMQNAASSPLVAALLCSLFHAGARMPSTEIELYERRFDLLLGRWDQAKGIRRLPTDLVNRYWKFITEIAFSMQLKESRVFSIDVAKDIAEEFFSKKYHGDKSDMVLDCVNRGIFEYEPLGELSFGHLTYQEFLASRKLLLENDIKCIFRELDNPWWDNTIKFYSASKEDISSLLKLAIDEDCEPDVAAHLLELVRLAPWTNKHLIEEIDQMLDHAGFEALSASLMGRGTLVEK